MPSPTKNLTYLTTPTQRAVLPPMPAFSGVPGGRTSVALRQPPPFRWALVRRAGQTGGLPRLLLEPVPFSGFARAVARTLWFRGSRRILVGQINPKGTR